MTSSDDNCSKKFLASVPRMLITAITSIAGFIGMLSVLQKDSASLYEAALQPTLESLKCLTSKQGEYLRDKDGIYKCEGIGKVWLDRNSHIAAIATVNRSLFARHRDGKIWRSTLEACTGHKKDNCPGWMLVDYNSNTVEISSDNANLYKHDSSGRAWIYNDPGHYCKEDDVAIGKDCPGWTLLEAGKTPRHLSKEK